MRIIKDHHRYWPMVGGIERELPGLLIEILEDLSLNNELSRLENFSRKL